MTHLTRKKVTMGTRYEVEVPLEQYGGDSVRVHALPDLTIARIEDRVGYSIEHALADIESTCLTDEEKADTENNISGHSITAKATKMISPKLKIFLGELVKEALVPDPECTCHGKGCSECDVSEIVEKLRGYSLIQIGLAVISASTCNWKQVEDFFSAQKAQSGPE
jgi:hypothetical protein